MMAVEVIAQHRDLEATIILLAILLKPPFSCGILTVLFVMPQKAAR